MGPSGATLDSGLPGGARNRGAGAAAAAHVMTPSRLRRNLRPVKPNLVSAAGAGCRPASSTACLLGALLLAMGLVLQGSALNLRWMRLVHALPGGLPSQAWAGLTLLGFGWAVAIPVLALDRGDGLVTALLARAIPLSILFTQLPKHLWFSPRPLRVLGAGELLALGEPVLQSSSMPSGHALAAFAGVGVLCLVRGRAGDSRPWALCTALLALGAGVAWSRVVVAAHWPSDVLAGAGLGLLAAGLAAEMESRWPWQQRLAEVASQRALALCEVGIALSWAATATGFKSVVALQWGLSALALCSALLRWRAAAVPKAVPVPARRSGGGV
jgi:membrane-associated phospholipid phosphatase